MRQVGVEENKIATVNLYGYVADVYRLDWTTDVYFRNCTGIDRPGYAIANSLEVAGIDMEHWFSLTRFNIEADTVIRFQLSEECTDTF